MIDIELNEEQTICRFCEGNGFICQKPSIPLVPGRLVLDLQGVKLRINFEKMEKCAKRIVLIGKARFKKELLIFCPKSEGESY